MITVVSCYLYDTRIYLPGKPVRGVAQQMERLLKYVSCQQVRFGSDSEHLGCAKGAGEHLPIEIWHKLCR